MAVSPEVLIVLVDCFTHIAQSMCWDDKISLWIIHIEVEEDS